VPVIAHLHVCWAAPWHGASRGFSVMDATTSFKHVYCVCSILCTESVRCDLLIIRHVDVSRTWFDIRCRCSIFYASSVGTAGEPVKLPLVLRDSVVESVEPTVIFDYKSCFLPALNEFALHGGPPPDPRVFLLIGTKKKLSDIDEMVPIYATIASQRALSDLANISQLLHVRTSVRLYVCLSVLTAGCHWLAVRRYGRHVCFVQFARWRHQSGVRQRFLQDGGTADEVCRLRLHLVGAQCDGWLRGRRPAVRQLSFCCIARQTHSGTNRTPAKTEIRYGRFTCAQKLMHDTELKITKN